MSENETEWERTVRLVNALIEWVNNLPNENLKEAFTLILGLEDWDPNYEPEPESEPEPGPGDSYLRPPTRLEELEDMLENAYLSLEYYSNLIENPDGTLTEEETYKAIDASVKATEDIQAEIERLKQDGS